uniref:(northern house mosquito) hypothetical protein n=1 Tax=Culex pipiens TaxID=7175 RepID=A0A8D8MQU3_CULPI
MQQADVKRNERKMHFILHKHTQDETTRKHKKNLVVILNRISLKKKCLKGIEEKIKMQKAPALRTTKKKQQIGMMLMMMLGLEEARSKNIFIYKNTDTFSLSC